MLRSLVWTLLVCSLALFVVNKCHAQEGACAPHSFIWLEHDVTVNSDCSAVIDDRQAPRENIESLIVWRSGSLQVALIEPDKVALFDADGVPHWMTVIK